MLSDRFEIHLLSWEHAKSGAAQVRHRVFVEEQGISPDLEFDPRDGEAVHALALAPNRQAVGTGRLLPSGQIGRLAVLAPWRRRGVGDALLRALVAAALERGLQAPFLHAQASAIAFYVRRGFRCSGAAFQEAGLEHRRMIYVAAAAEAAQ